MRNKVLYFVCCFLISGCSTSTVRTKVLICDNTENKKLFLGSAVDMAKEFDLDPSDYGYINAVVEKEKVKDILGCDKTECYANVAADLLATDNYITIEVNKNSNNNAQLILHKGSSIIEVKNVMIKLPDVALEQQNVVKEKISNVEGQQAVVKISQQIQLSPARVATETRQNNVNDYYIVTPEVDPIQNYVKPSVANYNSVGYDSGEPFYKSTWFWSTAGVFVVGAGIMGGVYFIKYH